MSKISEEQVRKIARLGGLHLNDADVSQYQKQFEVLLQHFDSLNQAEVAGIEPLYHAVDENHFRNDEDSPETLSRNELLNNSPDHDDVNFRLGRILGGAE
jgi:aspartyl-tRNA(Asn)/glutamyl-tRNA(Gln) amidotransferase subunit C